MIEQPLLGLPVQQTFPHTLRMILMLEVQAAVLFSVSPYYADMSFEGPCKTWPVSPSALCMQWIQITG